MFDAFSKFSKVTGLQENTEKSSIYMSGVEDQEKQAILRELGFVEGSLPFRYLGVLISSKKLTVEQCMPLVDRIVKRITCWTTKILTYAGRLQLIKAVIFGILTYWAEIFVLPKRIRKLVENSCRTFLWIGSVAISKRALVSWEKVYRSRATRLNESLDNFEIPKNATWVVRRIIEFRKMHLNINSLHGGVVERLRTAYHATALAMTSIVDWGADPLVPGKRRYERKSVLRFLETSESYRVERCLHICQEYGVIDAAAFLLERVGDIGSALLLLISSLNEKFILLDTAVESERCDTAPEHFKAILRKKEILRTCIGLCQRNSPRLDPDEAESLWFQLLDSFCEPLVDSHDHSIIRYKDEERAQEGEPACKIQWKVSKSHRNAHILRKLILRIILKLLSDNEMQEFGDFKPTILEMLGTYDFERRILDTAKSLIEDDTYSSLSLLKRGASHGFAPRSLLCCICNCPLTEDFSASSIQIFSCGHATHLQCEPQESEASFKGNSAGCPICMPRKNSEKLRSKSILLENGLVKSISKSQQTNGMTGPYLHENDGFDNSYGLQSISRFDLLLNLQKSHQSVQIENIPQLRLAAPPAAYYEKVKKRNVPSAGESSNGLAKAEKPSRSKQHLRDVKLKGSSLRVEELTVSAKR
ncbi:hypothetical protein BC332_08608 [Capsicum chinense]|nr:hypothetical protein BC332_08608 [Capsicum chinense]